MGIIRLSKIAFVAWRYGLDEIAATGAAATLGTRSSLALARMLRLGRPIGAPRGVRLRLALERLGPIFVKFGQVLSTRRDLLPPDIADELAKLQDRVPPFPSEAAMAEIERGARTAHRRRVRRVRPGPDRLGVHRAGAHREAEGRTARWRSRCCAPAWPRSSIATSRCCAPPAPCCCACRPTRRRLRPLDVIDEFDKHLHDELDLVREAANANQLRRNFEGSQLLRVPEMHWDYCVTNVLTMERMHGIPIGQMDRMRAAGIDLKKLSRDGVEIFFTQVFRHGFFHADMHPGNILVGDAGPDFNRYIALDFGIVGTLSESDKNYLAQNFLAFFRRDYRRVAELHVESGLGAARHASRGARGGGARLLRAGVRPAAEGDLARPGAAAAVPGLAPLQRRDPAATGAAAEDAAQHRRPGPPARPGPGPVDHREALPGTLDGGADRPGRPARALRARVHRSGRR